ncbi:MAG TPA: glycosyltransferase family 4 protein [Candidatus Limnocylindria bacterium]|nr:glycosyltransferase family 4 protein [Candidatus Limnocylindria bacterium]
MSGGSWRVSHVITRLILGGAQENTVSSVLGLRALPQFDVDLIAGPTVGAEGSIESTVSREPGLLTLLPSLIRPVRPWTDFLAYRALCRQFQRRRPHLVHTHSGKAGILGRLAARRAHVPLVLHTIHGPSFGPFQGPVANGVFRTAERVAGRLTDHFVVVANAMATQYLAAGIGRPSQYTRVFSGFDLHAFLSAQADPHLARKLGLEPGDFVVGKIARLFELKGHEELLQAAASVIRRIPRLKLLLVGDGPWRARFEAQAQELGLGKAVVFAGLVPPGDVPRYIKLMDVLVHLSHREGLPRALPQAMACGCPVMSWDCDGAGEVCLNDRTGYLLKMGDMTGLADRLCRLEQDPALRIRLGQAGRATVRDSFSIEAMVQGLAELYLRLLAEKKISPA